MENMGNWQFKSHHLLNLSGTINVCVADMTGHGHLDIVALVSQEWEEIYLFENDGHGNFSNKILFGSTNEDYGSSGIRFNVVAPGTIHTPNWDNQPGALETLSKLYPLGRVGEPEDIAAAVAFLGSDDAAWITGHTLPVEGGVLTGPTVLDLTPSGPFRKEQ